MTSGVHGAAAGLGTRRDGIVPHAPDQLKWCGGCRTKKPLSEFHVRNNDSKDGRSSRCKACRKAHFDKTDIKARCRERTERYRREAPHRYWASRVRNSHRKRSRSRKPLDVRISLDELEAMARETTHCPVCGTKLFYTPGGQGQPRPESASLDRKHNSRVMTVDSVWILCLRCNVAKGPWPLDDLYEWAAKVAGRNA